MDIDHEFEEKEEGNYIFCKKERGKWIPLYIGEGILKDRVANKKHKDCAVNKGATHIHAHPNRLQDVRLSEEQDLLRFYKRAHDPKGCNQTQDR